MEGYCDWREEQGKLSLVQGQLRLFLLAMRPSACSCSQHSAQPCTRMLCPSAYSLPLACSLSICLLPYSALRLLQSMQAKAPGNTWISETLCSTSARLRIFLGQMSIFAPRAAPGRAFLQKQQARVETARTQRPMPSHLCLVASRGNRISNGRALTLNTYY